MAMLGEAAVSYQIVLTKADKLARGRGARSAGDASAPTSQRKPARTPR